MLRVRNWQNNRRTGDIYRSQPKNLSARQTFERGAICVGNTFESVKIIHWSDRNCSSANTSLTLPRNFSSSSPFPFGCVPLLHGFPRVERTDARPRAPEEIKTLFPGFVPPFSSSYRAIYERYIGNTWSCCPYQSCCTESKRRPVKERQTPLA